MYKGLKKLPRDSRDYKLGAILKVKISDVPLVDFTIGNSVIKNQGQTQMCSAYASTSVSEDQEGVILSPEYQYAKTKQLDGDQEDGADLRTTAKSFCKFGSIEQFEYKENLTEDEIKRWWDWVEKYDPLCLKHRKMNFLSAEFPGLDRFDSIRLALWQYRNEKRTILSGVVWRQDWTYGTGIIKDTKGQIAGPHAIKIKGQKIINSVPYLVIQNSYGTNVGDKGLFYFPREVVNREFVFGNFMFLDLTQEQVATLLASQRTLYVRLITALKDLLDKLIPKV